MQTKQATNAKQQAKVILTRVANLADKPLQALADAGFAGINIPLIAIEENHQALNQLVNLDLSFYSKVILISPTAAKLFLKNRMALTQETGDFSKNRMALKQETGDFLKNRMALRQEFEAQSLKNHQFSKNTKFFSVGKHTCKLLHECDINCDFPTSGDKAEDLLAYLTSAKIGITKKDKILILKGEGGRDFLIPQLSLIAGKVDFLNLYERTKPQLSAIQVFDLVEGEALALVINSQTALENLVYFMQKAKSQWRLEQNLLVSSARLAKIAQDFGFKKILNTQTAGIDSVINKLKSLN